MLEQLSAITRRAGAMIREAKLSDAEITVKSSPGDLVTRYDLAVQEMLRGELQKIMPEADFIGEESGLVSRLPDSACFIVDPIDGTTNFAWDYRHSAVSIALADEGEITAGLIYNPYLDELFAAQLGQGAFLNGRPISVSKRRLREGLVCFGTSPYEKERAVETFELARQLYVHALDVRRSGSAALDLCYIACGRCELFYEMTLAPWDYAAASLIVSEAGGVVTTLDGQALQFTEKSSVLAGGREAYDDFRQLSGTCC